MSLRRTFKRLRKVVRKVAPLAAVAGLGFALGPAGVGVGQRILGGLGRAARGAGKLAAPVVEAVARGAEQQSAASPAFDQSDAALPAEQDFGPGFGRHRPRFARTLGTTAATFSEEEPSMSLLSNNGGGVLPGIGRVIGSVLSAKLQQRMAPKLTPVASSFQFGTGGALPPGVFPRPSIATSQRVLRTATGFTTGMGFPAPFVVGRRSKRINPTNVKALRRALRRVEGFVKLEKRVDKILRRAAPAARTARRSGFVKSRKR